MRHRHTPPSRTRTLWAIRPNVNPYASATPEIEFRISESSRTDHVPSLGRILPVRIAKVGIQCSNSTSQQCESSGQIHLRDEPLLGMWCVNNAEQFRFAVDLRDFMPLPIIFLQSMHASSSIGGHLVDCVVGSWASTVAPPAWSAYRRGRETCSSLRPDIRGGGTIFG